MPDTPSSTTPTPPSTPPPTAMPQQDERLFAAVGYIAFLFVVSLIVKPKSSFCRFHATQSMVLFLIAIVVLVVLGAVPWFGSLLTLLTFAVYVLAIYRSYKGEWWKIPFVSGFASKINVDSLYGKAGLAVSGISQLKEKATSVAGQAAESMKDLGKQEGEPPPQNPPPTQPSV